MTFDNEKKTYLEKLDKSKKGSIDEKAISMINIINEKEDYYTTSSCSGRAYLWAGTGKKNETEWLKVSHDLVDNSFFNVEKKGGLIWLRVEPFIIHIACKDIDSANRLLETARKIYKKSSLLSASNKIIIEIKGSELVEMPLFKDAKLLFDEDLNFLKELINNKLSSIWSNTEKLEKEIKLKNLFLPKQQG